MRRRDESGTPDTCPFIDIAIRELEQCQCDGVVTQDAIRALETVRGYNQDLRIWGNEQFHELQETKSEIDSLQDELDAARHDLADLKAEIRDLERQIDKLEGL
jgi:predicted  nucleic acid-binding Zn-ribbon protein